MAREEGHYTIKRVDSLPARGNFNYLYALKDTNITVLYRWTSQSKYEEIFLGGGGEAENVSVVPTGNLTSTDVQAALEELQADIDTLGQATQALPTGQLLVTTLLDGTNEPLSLNVVVLDSTGTEVVNDMSDPITGQLVVDLFVDTYSVQIITPTYEIIDIQNVVDNNPANNSLRQGNTIDNIDLGGIQTQVLATVSLEEPPILNSVLINNGAAESGNPDLTIDLQFTGVADEIIVSTSSSFTGATYEPFTTSTLNVRFDYVNDTTVTYYVKLRNSLGESAVVSDSIDLVSAFERSDNLVRYRTFKEAIESLEADMPNLTQDVTIRAIAPVVDTNEGNRFLAEILNFNQNSDFAFTFDGQDNVTIDGGTGGGILVRNSSNIIFRRINFINVGSLEEVSFPEQLPGIIAIGDVTNPMKSMIIEDCTFDGEYIDSAGVAHDGWYGIVVKNAQNLTINNVKMTNFGAFNIEIASVDCVSMNELDISLAETVRGVVSQPCLIEVATAKYCEILNSNLDADLADTICIFTNMERFYSRGTRYVNCRGEVFRVANTVELQEFAIEACELTGNLADPFYSYIKYLALFDSVTDLSVINCTVQMETPYGYTFYPRMFQVQGVCDRFISYNNIYEFKFSELENNYADGRIFQSPILNNLEADYNYIIDDSTSGTIRNLLYDVSDASSPLPLRRVQTLTDPDLAGNEANSNIIPQNGTLFTTEFSVLNSAVALPAHGVNTAVIPRADVTNQVFDQVRGAYSQTPTALPTLTDYGFDLLNTFDNQEFDETSTPVVTYSTNGLLFVPEYNDKSLSFKWSLESAQDTVVLYGSSVIATVLSELDGNGDYTADNTYDIELTPINNV